MNTPPMIFGKKGTPFAPDDPGPCEPETFCWYFGKIEIDVYEREYETTEEQELHRRIGTTEWGWSISILLESKIVSTELIDQRTNWSLSPAVAATKAEGTARRIAAAFASVVP